MILQIAWRNIWRNRLRSLVVMIAVAIGLSAGIFMMAFQYGINKERSKDMIETKVSHIQLHHPQFREDRKLSQFLVNGPEKLTELATDEENVRAVSGRVLVNGMLSTSKGGNGVIINAINPEGESELIQLEERLVAGKYFSGTRSKPILIGDKLAEKLGWKKEAIAEGENGEKGEPSYTLRKKVILTMQNIDGVTVRGQFRVCGIYKSSNSKFDEMNVYVKQSDVYPLIGQEGGFHEIAFLLNVHEMSEDSTYLNGLKTRYAETEVANWKDIAPDLKIMDESFEVSLYIFIGIILLAMLFGIINTMLMAVMERTRELGMLMSVGMNKLRVFSMIMLESIFLSIVGGISGLIIAFGLVEIFATKGIDLSGASEGLESIGMSTMVYTALEPKYYFIIALMVIMTAVIAAIYPAYKALKLKPAEAVRAI